MSKKRSLNFDFLNRTKEIEAQWDRFLLQPFRHYTNLCIQIFTGLVIIAVVFSCIPTHQICADKPEIKVVGSLTHNLSPRRQNSIKVRTGYRCKGIRGLLVNYWKNKID
jgi:hypothetical protein